MMEDVIQKGTGQAAKSIGRPIAGKTGTTNDFINAWFIGGAPNLVAGVYVGYDDPSQSLGPAETGSHAAAPIWLDYLKSVERSLPIEPFEQPPTVIAHRVDSEGRLVGACEASAGTRFEFFKAAAIPPRLQTDGNCFRPQLSTNGDAPTVREDPDL